MDIEKVIRVIEENDHIYKILKNCPYRILKKWSVHTYQKGEFVIHQGETFKYFNIIVKGEVNIYMMSENGKKYSQAIYKKGDFIGEIEIFDNSPSVCFVESLTHLKVLRIPVEDFLDWIHIDSHMSYYFNQVLARYLFNLSKKAGMDSLYPLNHRLSNYLIHHAKLKHNNCYIVKMSRSQIADQLAVTSRSISRILHEWKEQGIIQVESDCITIFNIECLKKVTKDDEL